MNLSSPFIRRRTYKCVSDYSLKSPPASFCSRRLAVMQSLSDAHGILSLPQELVDDIVGNVHKPRDVLALALSCRLFKELLIPHHLDYRCISAPITALELWTHLANNPSSSRNIRYLHITADSFHVPVRDVQVQDIRRKRGARHRLRAELILCKAIHAMKELVSFRWDRSSGCPRSGNAIWETIIESCPSLRTLDIFDEVYRPRCHSAGDNGPQDSDIDIFGVTPWFRAQRSIRIYDSKAMEISNLTQLTLRSDWWPMNRSAVQVINVKRLLSRSPQLQALDLSFIVKGEGAPLDDVLAGVHLPELRELRLSGVSCSAPVAGDFLSRHGSIRILLLDPYRTHGFDISMIGDGPLRHLQTFSGTHRSIVALASVRPPFLREIRDFRWVENESRDAVNPSVLAAALKYFAPSLREIREYAILLQDRDELVRNRVIREIGCMMPEVEIVYQS